MARQLVLEIEDDLFEYLELFSKTSGLKIEDIAKEELQQMILGNLDHWLDCPWIGRIKKILVKYGRYNKSILKDC